MATTHGYVYASGVEGTELVRMNDTPVSDTQSDAQAVDPRPRYTLLLEGEGLRVEREITQAQVLQVLAAVLERDTP